jgi:uncharacterized protein (TIGR02466 family)
MPSDTRVPTSFIPAPATIRSLFVTEIYQTSFAGTQLDPLISRVEEACRALAAEDKGGQDWSERQGYIGYTSYDSIDDLSAHAPVFAELEKLLDVHAAIFAQILEWDLRGQPLKMQRSWVNVLRPGGAHSGHIHPHSVISGTIYLAVPEGSGALQLEDPRHARMMHAPLRRPNARLDHQPVVGLAPERGTLLMWESWLRHEVSTNRGAEERISISFNYNL